MAAMEQLLRTSLSSAAADQASIPHLKVPEDTIKLRKQIAVVCDRLIKGGKLYKSSGGKKKAPSSKKQ